MHATVMDAVEGGHRLQERIDIAYPPTQKAHPTPRWPSRHSLVRPMQTSSPPGQRYTFPLGTPASEATSTKSEEVKTGQDGSTPSYTAGSESQVAAWVRFEQSAAQSAAIEGWATNWKYGCPRQKPGLGSKCAPP